MSFDKSLYEQKKVEYYDQARGEMLEFIPAHVGSVLDVGCSSGGFGRLLKEKRNCEVWGIEPTEAAEAAVGHLDRVFHDFFSPTVDLGGKKFDAIVFNDVLEHLANPWEALSLSRTMLTDKGCIVASIPNVQCYTVVRDLVFHGNWKYMPSGIMDKTHLRFFTKKSIVSMFEETGYKVSVIKGQNSIRDNSRLLKILHTLMRSKVEPFLYINYALCAYPR